MLLLLCLNIILFFGVWQILFRSEKIINLVDLAGGWCVDRLPCAV
jgi:hypothetical protein